MGFDSSVAIERLKRLLAVCYGSYQMC